MTLLMRDLPSATRRREMAFSEGINGRSLSCNSHESGNPVKLLKIQKLLDSSVRWNDDVLRIFFCI